VSGNRAVAAHGSLLYWPAAPIYSST